MHHNTTSAMVKMLLEVMTAAAEVVRNSDCDCDRHRRRTCDSWWHIM